MASLVSERSRRLVVPALGTLVVAGVLGLAAADPAPSSAVELNPFKGAKDLVSGVLGGPAKAIGSAGGSVFKEVLDFLIGDLQAVITLETIKFLTSVDLSIGPTLLAVTGPMIVVGGFFLVVGLITTVGDGYREVVAGTDTAPRVIGQAVFRVIGLALLLGSWFWLVPLAIDVANGMRDYVLSDAAVKEALSKSFRTQAILNANPLFALLLSVGLVLAMLGLIVLKFVIAIAFAMLYVGGPVLIGVAALPRIGNLPLSIAVRGVLTLMLVPLTWTVVFVAWAGVTGGLLEASEGAGDAVSKVMTGPALFLAGLVIMFGVTKKLLALAALGVPLSAPGSGLLRLAAARALGNGIGQAAGIAGNRAREDAGAASPGALDRTSGRAMPMSSGRQSPDFGSSGVKRFRTLPVTESSSTASLRSEENELRRERAAVSAVARVDPRTGGFRPREAPPEAGRAMVDRFEQTTSTWGDVPASRLGEARRSLGWGDRSGIGSAAAAAVEQFPEDDERRRAHFRHAMAAQYAGKHMDPLTRESIIAAGAAEPKAVLEVFGRDYEAFGGRLPGGEGSSGSDRLLFDGKFDEYREQQRTEPEGGEGRRS